MPTPQENLLFVEQASCLFSEKGAKLLSKKTFKKGLTNLGEFGNVIKSSERDAAHQA
jgi:hypothetical protein